jgi:GntR family transcriptional regulator/MocR family aminotransferase
MGAKAALRNNGARLVPVQVDAEGLRVSEGVAREPSAKMAFVSPSYQVPMCVTMSLPRRLALLDHAARTGMWVIEDDYDSEFRYAGRPLASLQSLDAAQRVIYIGTFSKSLLPALRLGFMVVPPDLVDVFTAARAVADRHAHTLEQAVVAEFIAEGHFAQHLRRMRTLYAERQAVLVSAAEKELAGLLEVKPADAGLNLVGWLPDGVSDVVASRAVEMVGLSAPSLSLFAMEPMARVGLLLGYAPFAPREIKRGVRELAAVLGKCAIDALR